MNVINLFARTFLALFILTLLVNPLAGGPASSYGGYISDNRISQGDRVEFSGVFHNSQNEPLYVVYFNVSFIENIGEATTRSPDKPNITKVYEEDRRLVLINQSLTETLSEVIDFDPGSYNVSIFFGYTNSTNIIQTTLLTKTYALANATFFIEGLTQGLEILRFIGYVIGGVSVIVIGLLVYNSRFRKSY